MKSVANGINFKNAKEKFKVLNSIAPNTLQVLNNTTKKTIIDWFFNNPKEIGFVLFILEKNDEIKALISKETILLNSNKPGVITFKTNSDIIEIDTANRKWILNNTVSKDIDFNPFDFIDENDVITINLLKKWGFRATYKFLERISNFIKCVEISGYDITDFINLKFTFPNNEYKVSYKNFNLINKEGKIIHFYIDESGKNITEIV
jgi:hypothetical protein